MYRDVYSDIIHNRENWKQPKIQWPKYEQMNSGIYNIIVDEWTTHQHGEVAQKY